MSYIEELRQRVESAERRFGLIDEQERRYSERLIGLMNALETAQTEKQTEAVAHGLRIAELERENGELRGMLHALLLGVEAGSRDSLAGTLRDLDSRLSGLLGAAPASAAATEEAVGLDAVSLGAETEDSLAEAELGVDEMPGAPEFDSDASVAEEIAVEEPVGEDLQAEEITPEDDVVAEEPVAEDIVDDESLPQEAVEEDAVAAAEQAVAALVGDAAPSGEGAGDAAVFDDMATGASEEIALEEPAEEPAEEPGQEPVAETADEPHGGMPPSPVAEMIVRLSEETRYFPEPEAAAEAPAPAPKPRAARKKA